MNEQIRLSQEEVEANNTIYRKRIDYLIKLGEVKLAEITNEKIVEETYFNLLELNTREVQFKELLTEKYGIGSIDPATGYYIKKQKQLIKQIRTYTWKVTGVKTVDTEDVTDAVVQTYWEKIGTDENGNEGTFKGATPFPQSSINSETFVPYTELTEEIILGWIQAVVVGSYEEHVNEQIQKQIDAKNIKQPDLPWASN